jgi:hypothetical protein
MIMMIIIMTMRQDCAWLLLLWSGVSEGGHELHEAVPDVAEAHHD